MKMIDVLIKLANGEIKEGTILKIPGEGLFGNKLVFDEEFFGKKKSVLDFEFYEDHFFCEEGLEIEVLYPLDTDFLNCEVELVPPKEKKYLVKFNMRWLRNGRKYLNYDKRGGHVNLNDKCETSSIQARFTEKELQDIQQVHEFLEDMEGKYELIEIGVEE